MPEQKKQGEQDHIHGPHCQHDHDGPVRNPWRNVGRNDPCPCGSGKKFKKCHALITAPAGWRQ